MANPTSAPAFHPAGPNAGVPGPIPGSKAPPRFMPNGAAMPPSGRPNIVFGSADSRPGSTPGSTHASLATPHDNRRITSPAASPSPIPKPMIASGGPPPPMANQTNLTFGSIRADGTYPGGNFGAHNSPGPHYRQPQPRNNIPHQFQPSGPAGMRPHSGSPFQPATRSPAMGNATIHQQQPVPGSSPAGYPPYPQHGLPPPFAMNGPGMPGQVPYGGYYPQFMPGMQHGYPGAPSSPRMYPGQVPSYPNQYHPNGPVMGPGPHSMDRALSGSVGSPHTMGAHPHGIPPMQQPGLGGPSVTPFARPPPRSKAIPIMTPEGNVVKVDEPKPSTAAPAKSDAKSDLVIVSSTPVSIKSEPAVKDSSRDSSAQAAQRAAEFQKQFREQLKAKEEEARQLKLAEAAAATAAAATEEQSVQTKPTMTDAPSEGATKNADSEESASVQAASTEAAPVPTESSTPAEIPSSANQGEMEAAKDKADSSLPPQETAGPQQQASEEPQSTTAVTDQPSEAVNQPVTEKPSEPASASETAAEEPSQESSEQPPVSEAPSSAPHTESATPVEPSVAPPKPEAAKTEGTSEAKFTPSAALGSGSSTLPKSVLNLRPKPDPLSIPGKPAEPGVPTPGMLSLKAARPIDIKTDNVEYPEGFSAPNPEGADHRKYDAPFLMQFREVFKEKPETDWEVKIKGTVGDTTPGSARGTPAAMSRQSSRAGMGSSGMGTMGSFGSMGSRMGPMDGRFQPRPMGMMGQGPNRSGGPLPFSLSSGGRSGSHAGGPNPLNLSSRQGSSRGRMSRRGDRPPPSSELAESAKPKEQPTPAPAAKPAEPEPAAPPARRPRFGPKETLDDGSLNPAWVSSKVTYSLNRLAPDNFAKILPEMEEIIAKSTTESDGRTLNTVINMLFEKACSESKWSEMYARACYHIYTWLSNPDGPGPSIKDERLKKKNSTEPQSGGNLFRSYLLTKCQSKFEEGEKAEPIPEDIAELDAGGDAEMLSDEYYKQIREKTFRLGLFRFIGELYKLGMVTDKVIVECMRTLMRTSFPDEPSVERLNCLIRTVGPHVVAYSRVVHEGVTYDGPAKAEMERCFAEFLRIVEKHKNAPGVPDEADDEATLAKRPVMLLMNLIEFRKRNWQDAIPTSIGPTTIDEIHREAAQKQEAERQQHQAQRNVGRLPQLGRGDARSFSGPTTNSSLLSLDDLSKLRQQSGGLFKSSERKLGPPGFALSNSRRNGRTGSNLTRGGTDSHSSSRTGTPKEKDSLASARVNAFSALQSLDTEGASEDVVSVRSEHSPSPPASKEAPSATQAVDSAPSADV